MLPGLRFWCVISLAMLPIALFAGEGGGLDYNLVQLSADAQAEVPNDQMEVLVSVEHESRDAAALPALVNADMRWALDLARKRSAVKSETREYTTQPQYASGRIVGWRAQQQLHLESNDFGELTALVTALQEKLQVKSMRFLPRRETRVEVENELTRKALQAFAAKAMLVAETMGAARYEVVEIAVNGQPQPYPVRARGMEVMAMAAADAPVPVAVEAGSETLTVSVSGRIQLR
jgi:predicted secreted protein